MEGSSALELPHDTLATCKVALTFKRGLGEIDSWGCSTHLTGGVSTISQDKGVSDAPSLRGQEKKSWADMKVDKLLVKRKDL